MVKIIDKEIKTILVTGGAGFIGSNFLNIFVPKHPDITFINLDKLTEAGNLDKINVSDSPNYHFVHGDICDADVLDKIFNDFDVDGIIHFAAESHVDNSIENPNIFYQSNVIGTNNLLEYGRRNGVTRFHHVSTDEVYGELDENGYFAETTPINPSSPYSASKAGSDFAVLAAHRTFGMNATISRCSNNYGAGQNLISLIPKIITNVANNQPIPIYGDGSNVRDWLYVDDHCQAIWEIFCHGKAGEVYNIGTNNELTNLEITKKILQLMGKPESLIEFVEDRPGHDFRYAIDPTKIGNELGWKPQSNFDQCLQKTIDYYVKDTN